MTGIADTGFLVAFANRKDRHHGWALDVASKIDRALLTCDAVLAETAPSSTWFSKAWWIRDL